MLSCQDIFYQRKIYTLVIILPIIKSMLKSITAIKLFWVIKKNCQLVIILRGICTNLFQAYQSVQYRRKMRHLGSLCDELTIIVLHHTIFFSPNSGKKYLKIAVLGV